VSENANVKNLISTETTILFVKQYKNDNTTFHLSSAVAVVLALKFDVTGVLNCEKLIDNFACLKAWKKNFVIDCHCWICWWQIFGICWCRYLYICLIFMDI